MISSLYQIDFITASGTITNLLNANDLIDKEIDFPFQNNVENFCAIGAQWGKSKAKGGARRPIAFGRYQEHTSHAEAATWCLMHPALLPSMQAGKVRVTIAGSTPVVFDLLDAVIIGAIPVRSPDGVFCTFTAYHLEAGKLVPVSGLAYFSGMPHSWIPTAAASLSSTLAANHAAA